MPQKEARLRREMAMARPDGADEECRGKPCENETPHSCAPMVSSMLCDTSDKLQDSNVLDKLKVMTAV